MNVLTNAITHHNAYSAGVRPTANITGTKPSLKVELVLGHLWVGMGMRVPVFSNLGGGVYCIYYTILSNFSFS